MLLIQVDVKAFALFLALSLLSVRGVFPLRALDFHQNRLIIAGLRSAFCHQDDPAAGFSICLWRSKYLIFGAQKFSFRMGGIFFQTGFSPEMMEILGGGVCMMNHLINQAANLISGAFDFLVLSLTRLIGSYFYGFDRKCRLICMTEMTDCRGRGDPGGDRDTVFSTEIQNHR